MKIGMVCPGQGSQSVGMQATLFDEQVFKDTYVEASDVLGLDLAALARSGPAEAIGRTEITQPLMLTAGVATARLWLARGGPQPSILAGHSLGEFTALVLAGVLGFRDAVALVRVRATLMQEAVPAGTGTMAAILGLDDAEVEAACAEAANGEVVEAVNYNQPGQVVIAGHAQAVKRAMDAAKARGAKRALPLAVSIPAHSSLLAGAAARFAEVLARVEVRAPAVPVLGIGGQLHGGPALIREAVVLQLHRPVRWTDTVLAMASTGVGAIVECGPGKVLSGLNRRIVTDEVRIYTTDDAGAFAAALAATAA